MHLTVTGQLSRLKLTSHAKQRSQQRGLREALINTVHDYADLEAHVGRSCRRMSISSNELNRLVAEGLLTPAEAGRCKNVTLIVTDGDVVTAYRH